ncbi:collagen-like protein [Ascidiimonas sp. W6]|uniref:collagen-like protein n=1 Tax=Ascidiimonas meishanensis TaxID=3128903 RepID=UPI0030EF4F73
MKHFGKLLLAFSVLFISCEGDPGPPGFDGLDGLDGESLLGTVFETPAINFNQGNDFSASFDFPTNFEVFESDAILVYLLEDVTGDGNGGEADIWTPLPQTFFLNEGTLLYSFNHTFFDVALFLDGNFDLSLTPDGFTQNQIFRIVVVPAEFGQASNVDLSNFSQVMKAMGKSEIDIIKMTREQ